MILRTFVALLLAVIILAVCFGCAIHVRHCLDPLLQQLDHLEKQIRLGSADALSFAQQWHLSFQQAINILPFYVSHDALESATESAASMVLFLSQDRITLSLEQLLLCRQRLQHIRDWEQFFPENVF